MREYERESQQWSVGGEGPGDCNRFRFESVLRKLLSHWLQGLGRHGMQCAAWARTLALRVASHALPCTDVDGALSDGGNSLNLSHAWPNPEATAGCSMAGSGHVNRIYLGFTTPGFFLSKSSRKLKCRELSPFFHCSHRIQCPVADLCFISAFQAIPAKHPKT